MPNPVPSLLAPQTEVPQDPAVDKSSLTGCCLISDPVEKASALVAVARRWQDAVRPLWAAWHEAGGMTYSDQFGSYNADTATWQNRTPAPERKVTRVELNHMEPIISDVATLQVQDPPNMRATAPTDSSAAASSSICADQLTWALWERDGYDEKNLMLREDCAAYGNSFLFPAWDANGGRLVDQIVDYKLEPGPPDPITGMPGSLGLYPVHAKVREGCFEDRIVSCFAAIPDPCAKDEWDGEGFIIHEMFSLAAAKRNYPEHAKDFVVSSNTAGDQGAYYESRLHNASPRTGGINVLDEQNGRKVDQWTIFVRTSADMYRGKWIVIVCGEIVYESDNPVYPTQVEEDKGEEFPSYHWPVWRFAHKLVRGSYFGQGIAIRMIGAQKKLNGVASKKLHMLKRTSHPTLVKPARANFVKTDEPDQQINVPNDLQPGSIYYLTSPGIPQELQLEERLSVEQMERIAGLHAGSRGESENGDSGTKTRQLFQRDLGRLAAAKYRNDKQLGQAFGYKLRLWRRYATVARTIRVVGENNAVSVKSFDMSSIAAGTDIVVYQDTGLPRDPSSRMLHVEKAVQLGIVDPHDPVQRQGLAEVLGLAGSFRKWESSLAADRRCAEDEAMRMYDGEQPAVEFWHDDMQHLAAHYAEMNTEAWRRASTPLPGDTQQVAAKKQAVRAIYLQHVQAHQQQVAQKKQSQEASVVPKELMNFKDLPPDGQRQMAAQAGIQLAPAKSGATPAAPGPEQPKQAPRPRSGGQLPPPPQASAGPQTQKLAA